MNKKGKFECPHCSEEVVIDLPSGETNNSITAPKVRGNLKPRDIIYEYRITTAQIRDFCAAKLDYYCPGAKLTLLPHGTDKTKRGNGRIEFAALHLAFTSEVIEAHQNGFLDRVGIDPHNVQLTREVWVKLVKSWQFDVSELVAIRKEKDYRKLEELKERLNITESYLEWLIAFSSPRKLEMPDGKELITMAARTDAILRNMLEDPNDEEDYFRGNMVIHSIKDIDSSNMEFIVHVSRSPKATDINPEITTMMRETRKNKM